MSETLELPAIDPALIDKPAMPVAVVPPESVATLKQTVVASFVPIKAHCAQLAAKHRGAAFDFKTPKGLEAAKAARHELREEGRYAVQRLEKRLKAEANDLKKTVEAEAAEAIEHIQPVEDKLHADITAREAEVDAEREKARQIEEARKEGHRSAIEAIRICIDRCKAPGMTSARIANGMEKLRAVEVGSAFEEFEEQAKRVKAETLAAMQREHDDLLAREQEAARLEAQRIENERIAAEQARVAAELAAQQRALAEQAAELARQQQEIEAARQRAITPAAPAATEGKADTPCAGSTEAAPINPGEDKHGPEASAASADRAGEAPRHEAVAQDAAGEPAADPGLGGRDSERGSGVVDSEHGSGVDPADAAGHAGRGDETGGSIAALNPTSVAAPRHDPWIGHAESAAYGPDLLDPVTAAIEAEAAAEATGVAMLGLEEPSAAAKAVAELASLRGEAMAGKFPSQPKVGAEWWARFYAAVDALEVAAAWEIA